MGCIYTNPWREWNENNMALMFFGEDFIVDLTKTL